MGLCVYEHKNMVLISSSSNVTGFIPDFYCYTFLVCGTGYRSRYNGFLRAGRSGDRIPVGAIFSAPV